MDDARAATREVLNPKLWMWIVTRCKLAFESLHHINVLALSQFADRFIARPR